LLKLIIYNVTKFYFNCCTIELSIHQKMLKKYKNRFPQKCLTAFNSCTEAWSNGCENLTLSSQE